MKNVILERDIINAMINIIDKLCLPFCGLFLLSFIILHTIVIN